MLLFNNPLLIILKPPFNPVLLIYLMEAPNQFVDEVDSPMKILLLYASVKLLLNLAFDVTFKRPVIEMKH